MTYVVTPNSFTSQLNQIPQAQGKFIVDGITDPIVQQNFEILNKAVARQIQGQDIQKANLIVGPAFSNNGAGFQVLTGTALHAIGALQCQITTRGNPVRLLMSPFSYQVSAPSYFWIIDTTNLGTQAVKMQWGWRRTDANGIQTVLCNSIVGTTIFDGSTATSSIGLYIPFSAFEFIDVVPSGTYTYQFLFQMLGVNNTANISNVNVLALELR